MIFEPGAVYEITEKNGHSFRWIHLYGYRRITYNYFSRDTTRSYETTVLCDGHIQDWLFFQKDMIKVKKIS